MRGKMKKILSILGTFFLFSLALAETCPEKTTVNGPTSITFVGGVVDMGGDTQASVWFEYGEKSGDYKFKTPKKIVTQPGKYCITVSNLKPCTTYYYRAAMENKAGPSFGAEQSRKTLCETPKKVLGTATSAPTGLSDRINRFFLFPLFLAGILTWILKSHILRWEEWVERRKAEYQKFKTDRLLRSKIEEFKSKK